MPRNARFVRPNRRTTTVARRARAGTFAMPTPDRALSPRAVAVQKIADWTPPATGIGELWQRESYGYADVIGELGYVTHLTANTASKANLVPSVWNADLRAWEPTKDPRVLRAWAAFVGPRGGHAELIRRAALHMLIAGEAYLVGSPLKKLSGEEVGFEWEFLSVEELRVENNGKTVKRNRTGKASDAAFVDITAYVARLWNSDPRISERSYSQLKRNLPICREIVVLTQVVDAIAKSRLSAGILFVPDELTFGPEDEKENESGSDDIDQFIQDLIEHLTAPVTDRSSAASLVPLILRGAAEYGKEVRLIDIARDLDKLYSDLRQEAIGRLGGGLDIPPEVMNGKAGLNHWTGYNIDADFIVKHVDPLLTMILEFVTEAFLRPMLRRYEDMSVEDAQTFSIQGDTTSITKRADSGPAARAVYTLGELSGEALRRENGFDEADAPNEDERAKRIMLELIRARPLELARVLLPKLLPNHDWSDVPEFTEVIVPGRDPVLEDRAPTGEDPADPDLGTGMQEPVPSEEALVDRLATAADAALDRALERAGSRVLSKLNGRDSELRTRLEAMPRTDVLSATSPTVLSSLRETPAGLLAGAWDQLEGKAHDWIAAHLRAAGVVEWLAEDQAAAVTREFVGLLEMHALSVTRRPLVPGENGLRVPAELVTEALKASRRVLGEPDRELVGAGT